MGYIDILPALPLALPDGEISGVCVRGGFELTFSWQSGELIGLEVLSKAGEPCTLKYGEKTKEFKTRANQVYCFDSRLKKI